MTMGALKILTCTVIIWQTCCKYFRIPPFILPSPVAIARASYINRGILLSHSFITFSEIMLGIGLALLIAVPTAILMFRSRKAEQTLEPILVTSQAIPVFAIAPLLVIWFGYGMTSKVVMASIIIYFPITISLLQGFRSCDREYRELFRIMGADFWQSMKMLYWPWALPYFFGGLKVAVSVATIGAVIGEWVGSQAGLGYLMIQSNARLKIDLVFASILWLSIIGLSLWKLTGFLESTILKWNHINQEEEF